MTRILILIGLFVLCAIAIPALLWVMSRALEAQRQRKIRRTKEL